MFLNLFILNKESSWSLFFTLLLLNTDLAPPQYPVLAADHSSQQEDPNQLVLPFDKKYDLNDIFSKIDDVYRKIITLENEVYKLRELVENKKKEL